MKDQPLTATLSRLQQVTGAENLQHLAEILGYRSPRELTTLIDETEAASILSVAVSSMQKNRFYGQGLPYQKVGRLCRYVAADVHLAALSQRIVPEVSA